MSANVPLIYIYIYTRRPSRAARGGGLADRWRECAARRREREREGKKKTANGSGMGGGESRGRGTGEGEREREGEGQTEGAGARLVFNGPSKAADPCSSAAAAAHSLPPQPWADAVHGVDRKVGEGSADKEQHACAGCHARGIRSPVAEEDVAALPPAAEAADAACEVPVAPAVVHTPVRVAGARAKGVEAALVPCFL